MSKSKSSSRPWFEQLVDSVEALREAAGEWQRAYRAAGLMPAGVDWVRRQSTDGQVARVRADRPERAWDHTRTSRPHHQALSALSRLYTDLVGRADRGYEDAAMLYASGVVWAVRQVQDGHQPPMVSFGTDGDGDAVPYGIGEITDIDRLSTAPRIKAAYEAVARQQAAAEYAEELAGRDYVSDHEAGEFHDALDASRGMSDAAYAYGIQAEGALRYVLLEPRKRAAAEPATDAPAG
ncbi:hypothetical protein [Streptomyces sp. NPDC005953]|uniref:hypothetical protein n=1 Tax=Streptomyces sp. NPDC005953 TaxID=3156719 RepID=UPI0033DD53C1